MKTLIQITGVQYACPENSVLAVMAELEKQHPEVLLVTEHTHDYGIIVRALIGTEYRGVVSRFDIEQVLRMMQHDSTATLVGQLAETDLEGRCFTVCIDGDYPTPDTPNDNQTGIWSNWQWTGAPLLDSTADDRRQTHGENGGRPGAAVAVLAPEHREPTLPTGRWRQTG